MDEAEEELGEASELVVAGSEESLEEGVCVLTEVEEKIELEHPETAAIPATVKKPKAVRRVKSEVIYPIFHSARLRYINYTARTSACGGAPPYSLRRKSWEPISGRFV